MQDDLLSLLAEPGTQAPLDLVDAVRDNGHIVSGRLVVKGTQRSYPIVRGIPRFVSDDSYAASFGMQWNKFRDVQVDSETGGTHSVQRFDAETGWTRATLDGKWCLDMGCGAGRFAEVAASRGARLVGLDLSSAIDATAQTLAKYPNVNLVQASALQPPFRHGAFDFAYSIGVIQHTPDPPRVVREVVSCVRPGGQFALTIYARRLWTKLNTKYLIRPLTKRLPADLLLKGIQKSMPLLFPITDRLFRIPLLGKVFQFTIPVANYVHRNDFSRDQRYAEAVLDTFDMLSPAYDSPMTWNEVEAELKLVNAKSWDFQKRIPIECRGIR